MKVCLLGGGNVKAFAGETVGGAEKQQAMIIKGLKKYGIDVVVIDYELKESLILEGIPFYPAWHANQVKFKNKFRDLLVRIRKQDADVIYVRATQLYAALLFFYLKLIHTKTRLIWGIAGDQDLTSKYNHTRVKYAKSLYEKINEGILFNLSSKILFNFADMIVCQTHEQLIKCKSISDKKELRIISNIYQSDNQIINTNNHDKVADAIWVGKFSGNKGEEVLLKVSMSLPEVKIICIGHVTENFKESELFKRICKQPNLILIGRVRNDEVKVYISKVDYVLNTSPSEGLSNVFLEGWDQEKPIISYIVNPNQYLTEGEAGYCAQGSFFDLIAKMKEIHKNKVFVEYHGKKGKEIVERNHTPRVIIPKYLEIFSA